MVVLKEKISITLSKDILESIDLLAGSKRSRSALIERVLRQYLRERAKAALHAQDLERINHAAERLNLEVAEVLDFQAQARRSFAGIQLAKLH